MRLPIRFLTCLAMAFSFCGADAANGATVINWTGASDFEDATISFSSFTANQLTDITDTAGIAYWHDHFDGGPAMNITLDVRVDGIWQTLFSHTSTDTLDHPIHQIPTPITFTGGLVDGLRFTSDPNQSNSYHAFDSTLQFHFDEVATGTVPEPATLAIWGVGTLGFAAFSYRRRAKLKSRGAE